MNAVAAPTRPYKGLAAFDDAPADALFFFGRERERAIIVANLLASRLTVLYGASGVGKTSLLRAGVAQELRSLEDATAAIFVSWSDDPTHEIDEVVARADGHTYLILDQIEEYFLYHGPDAPFARRLPELVTDPTLRVNVLLGVREDALAQLDFFKGRIPNLFANYLRLEHLGRDAARAAVLGPLDRLNELEPTAEPYGAEPELVEAVLDEVATGQIEYGLAGRGAISGRDEPARVEAPFLQLVLERLWDVEREAGSRTLRLETLRNLGGAETIVHGHLARALEALEPAQRELAAEMFSHLVTPSGTKIAHDTGDLARYATAAEPEVDDVLARLAAERIVRALDPGSNGGRYEIFHDVLASGVLAWRASFEAEQELERERARRRRAIAFAGTALLALAVVAAIALFALAQRERAQDRATTARAREQAARALSLLTVDPQRSLRLAIAAADDERTPQISDVLRTSLLASRQRRVFAARPDATVVAFDPGGRMLVPYGDDLRAYSRTAGRRPERVLALGGPLLALSPDGALAAVADRRRVVLRSTEDGRVVSTVEFRGPVRSARFDVSSSRLAVVAANAAGHEFGHVVRVADGVRTHVFRHRGTKSVAFSPDGRLFATGSADDSARIWRLSDGKQLRSLGEHTGDVLAVEFSPDGTLLATASADSGVRVWRTATGERRFLFVGHNNPTIALAWSRDGRFIADASLDRTARILDIGGIGAGRMAAVLIGHEDGLSAIAYSADGRTIATVARDGTARLWDARAEHELLRVASHPPGRTGVSFDPAGRFALSWGVDGARVTELGSRRDVALDAGRDVTLARFDPGGSRVVTARPAGVRVHTRDGRKLHELPHREPVTDAVYARDGRLVTASIDGWARVFGRRGRLLAHLDHGESVTRVAVRDDGLIATATASGAIRLWQPGAAATVASGHERGVNALGFSPDGERLVSAGDDGAVRVWQAGSGALLFELLGHVGGASGAAFAPSGHTIVTTDRGRHVRAWDAQTGALRRELVGHFAPVNSVAFSSDGRWLVTTSSIAAVLWQASATSPFAYLRGHTAPVVRHAEFSRDGRYVVTTGDDGSVRLYRCEVCGGIDELVALARRRVAAATPAR
jgi:WD40 repeat protein